GGDDGHQHQRHNDEGQQNVRDEDEKVDGANQALGFKPGNGTGVEVVGQVGGKKDDRGDQRAAHHADVPRLLIPADEPPAEQQKEGADGVESRVDRGQIADAHYGFS